MKTILLLTIIILLGERNNAQTLIPTSENCLNFKTGVFKLSDNSVYTIVRSAHKQIENDIKTGSITALDIKWLTDCSYILFNPKVVEGKDDIPPEFKTDTMYNEITKIDGNSIIVVTTSRKFNFETQTSLFKVEDSLLYRDIKDLPAFKEYNGTSWGGTIIDDNYAVAYRQKADSKDDFVFAFEEAYVINHKAMFRLLDNILYTKKDNQSIATRNCRFNEKYDPEIIAIYSSKNDEKESKIIKAWRCNRKTLKIELIEPKNVKYKVADKSLNLWNK